MNTLTATHARLTENGRQNQKYSGKETIGNDYKAKIEPKGYFCTHGLKVLRVHTRLTFVKRKHGHKEKANRSDTMGGSNKDIGWVAGEYGLVEVNGINKIKIYHYFNTLDHPHTIDNTT